LMVMVALVLAEEPVTGNQLLDAFRPTEFV
jgi:hypothetical protein